MVWDRGQYTYVAEKLAEEFDVKYYVPLNSGFPESRQGMVGMGLDGIDRVFEFWEHLDDIDLFVFPDVYDADVQAYLRKLGKAVWGSGEAAWFELDRLYFHKYLQARGEPVAPTKVFVGCDELEDYLRKDPDECYVKTSFFRGDFETKRFVRWDLFQYWLNKQRASLGPRAQTVQFIVESKVEGIEIGYDAYQVHGELPPMVLYGYEAKDSAFLGRVCSLEDVPTRLLEPTRLLLPEMRDVACSYHNEVRLAPDGRNYYTDPCMRFGCPPSESMLEAFSNWPEVILAGAQGHMVPLVPRCRYAAQLILKSAWVEENWLPVRFPASLKPWVKLHNACVVDGTHFVSPLDDFVEFGSVVGIGDTMEEAITECSKNLEKVQTIDLIAGPEAFEPLLETVEKGLEEDVNF